MELKEMCKFVRYNLSMSQKEFGKLIKSNQTEISFIERGFIPENKDKIEVIKSLYNIYNRS